MQLAIPVRADSELGAGASVAVLAFVMAQLALAEDPVFRVAALQRGRDMGARKQVGCAGGAHASRLDPARATGPQARCRGRVQRGTTGQGSAGGDPAVAPRDRQATPGRGEADIQAVGERLGACAAQRSDPSQRLALLRCDGPSLLAGDASLLARDPSLLARDPSLLARDPSLLARDPSLLARDPSLLARDPSLLARDPSLLAGYPCPLPDRRRFLTAPWRSLAALPPRRRDFFLPCHEIYSLLWLNRNRAQSRPAHCLRRDRARVRLGPNASAPRSQGPCDGAARACAPPRRAQRSCRQRRPGTEHARYAHRPVAGELDHRGVPVRKVAHRRRR